MPFKPQSDEEVLARLDASLAEDILTESHTDADVAAALRAAGGDPDAIGRRGAALAAQLLERRRLAWQEKAKARIASVESIFSTPKDYSTLKAPALLSQLHAARNNPRLSAPIGQLFHKRKLEESSEEELRELLREVDALTALDQAAASDESDEP